MTKISTDLPAFRVLPAQPEEAGAFFAQTPEQNAQMGAIGCVRMDFGRNGTAFWHTWHPRGREELNTPEFKADLQLVVDTLRETVLKDLSSMWRFCYENGGKIPGGWSQNYGYGWLDAETEEIVYNTNGMPDITANEMYHVATVSGTIDTIPETPGLAVWHEGHIGVYIGNGEVVEAMGTRYGVVKTKLEGARWTHWLKIPYISYD